MAIKQSVAISKVLERATARLQAKPQLGAAEMVAGGRKIATLLSGLEDIAHKRNPTETPEAHALRVAKAAEKLLAQIAASEDTDNVTRANAARDIQARLNERTKLIDTPRGEEIRTWFRGLSSKQRHDTLQTAINAGDSELLGSVLGAPYYLSGLSQDQAQGYRTHYEQKVAPDLTAETEELFAADSAVATIRRVAREVASDARNPDYIQRIEAEKAEAERAQASFDAASQ